MSDDLPKQALEFAPVRVATSLGTLIEANLCRMALAEAGIEAWLSTEHLSGVAPHLGFTIGVDVLVRPEAVAAARSVLASLEAGAAALRYEPERCPDCGSLETEHRRLGADRVTALSDWAPASVAPPSGVWRWRCNACGREWD